MFLLKNEVFLSYYDTDVAARAQLGDPGVTEKEKRAEYNTSNSVENILKEDARAIPGCSRTGEQEDTIDDVFIESGEQEDTLDDVFIESGEQEDTLDDVFIESGEQEDTLDNVFIESGEQDDTIDDVFMESGEEDDAFTEPAAMDDDDDVQIIDPEEEYFTIAEVSDAVDFQLSMIDFQIKKNIPLIAERGQVELKITTVYTLNQEGRSRADILPQNTGYSEMFFPEHTFKCLCEIGILLVIELVRCSVCSMLYHAPCHGYFSLKNYVEDQFKCFNCRTTDRIIAYLPAGPFIQLVAKVRLFIYYLRRNSVVPADILSRVSQLDKILILELLPGANIFINRKGVETCTIDMVNLKRAEKQYFDIKEIPTSG